MPTKLYEYVALKLPILLQHHTPWVEYCKPFAGAIVLDDNLTPTTLLTQMKSKAFYTSEPENATWYSEEAKLLQTIDKLSI